MVFVGYGNIQMNYISIRQSDKWDEYLKFLGWRILKNKKGTKIAILKTFIGNVTKIQRLKKFDEQELKDIEDLCIKNKALFIKIEPMQDQDMSVLTENGYRNSAFPLSPTSTLLINLEKSEEDLWKDLSPSSR